MLSLHQPPQVLHAAELQSLIAEFELQFEEHCCDDIAEEKLALVMRHEREELALGLCHEREELARLERVQCRRDRYVMVLLKDHIACLLGGDEGMVLGGDEGMDETGSAVIRGPGEDAGDQPAFAAEERRARMVKTEIVDEDSAEDEEMEKIEIGVSAARDHPVVPLLPRTTTRNSVGRDETVVLGSNRGQLTEYHVLRCECCPTKPFRPYAHDACELSALWRDHVDCFEQNHAVPSSIDVTGVFGWKIVDADDNWYETHLRGFHAGNQGWSTPDCEWPPSESKGTPRASKVGDKDNNYRVKVKTEGRSHHQAVRKRSNEKESLTEDLERAASPTKINLKKNHEVTETPCAKPPTGDQRSPNGGPKPGSGSRRSKSYMAIPIAARKRGARHVIITPAAAQKRPLSLSTAGAGSGFKRRVTPSSQALRDGNGKRLRTDGLVGRVGP